MPVSRRKYWSGRPDLNRRPPAPKVNSKTLSSCLVYVFRASYITVYGGIRRLLFPHCSQLSRSEQMIHHAVRKRKSLMAARCLAI